MAQSDLNRTIPALEKLAQEHAFELVDAEIAREGASRYLRIYIDKPGGITLDDCEIYHRAVSPLVEHLDFDFLEVCSPGLDRPLKRQKDFDANAGKKVEVRLYKPQDGQKAFEGKLTGLSDGVLTIETAGGSRSFAAKDVSLCKLIVEIDEDDLNQPDDGGEDVNGGDTNG